MGNPGKVGGMSDDNWGFLLEENADTDGMVVGEPVTDGQTRALMESWEEESWM